MFFACKCLVTSMFLFGYEHSSKIPTFTKSTKSVDLLGKWYVLSSNTLIPEYINTLQKSGSNYHNYLQFFNHLLFVWRAMWHAHICKQTVEGYKLTKNEQSTRFMLYSICLTSQTLLLIVIHCLTNCNIMRGLLPFMVHIYKECYIPGINAKDIANCFALFAPYDCYRMKVC